ncbi:MAG: hypothetical protein ACYS99_18715, partial [Planctomycetota bacterium]
ALAEVILRGLRAIPGLDVEIEMVFEEPTALDLLSCRRYDLLVVGSGNGSVSTRLFDARPGGLPAVAVGGPPADRSGGTNGVPRVPLPFSFRLLESAVLRALDRRDEDGEEPLRRRDSVG